MFQLSPIQCQSGSIRDLTIVHLSDMHWYSEKDIEIFCERLKQALKNTDPTRTIVVSTGDWLCEKTDFLIGRLFWWCDRDTNWSQISSKVVEMHSLLQDFPYKFTCWGNHDLGHPEFKTLRKELKQSFHDGDIQTMHDRGKKEPRHIDLRIGQEQVRVIITNDYCPEGLGKEDICEQELYLPGYVRRIRRLAQKKNTLKIILTHNAEWIETHQTKFSDLSDCLFLAGHTHQGLVNIPGPRELALWKLHYKSKLIGGAYQLKDEKICKRNNALNLENPAVVVSRGMGDCPLLRPLRCNCRYEIPLLLLKN